ncbi:hypothetical protein [Mesorhizobium sp.]|nr:hypothetical protein [Mesorhizobium sp.]
MRLAAGRGHLLAVGNARDIADTMQQWFEGGAADGFNVMAPVMPADLQSFVDEVMPLLERSDVFGAGRTLRQRYGLPRL